MYQSLLTVRFKSIGIVKLKLKADIEVLAIIRSPVVVPLCVKLNRLLVLAIFFVFVNAIGVELDILTGRVVSSFLIETVTLVMFVDLKRL